MSPAGKDKSKDKTVEETKVVKLTPNDLEWSDHVLSLLSDDEKISGNPTTDGLRRIFEIALDCSIIDSSSTVVQSPSPDNEKRATVVHSLTFVLNDDSVPEETKYRTVNGSADVYWGNCDKVYRNHPVAVAETRAEGRALRRGLKLRKVVAAEEIASNVEDDVSADSVGKISANQISFIDVMAKRLNINVTELLTTMSISVKNINSLTHDDAVAIIRQLSSHQQNVDNIPSNLKPYQENWK